MRPLIALTALTALTALALAAPALAAPALAAPAVTNAWVRLNPVPGRASAGYLVLTGDGKADRLTAVTAPGVKIELHSMTMAGGMMHMGAMDGLDVPAKGAAAFAPGGSHLMIYGLDPKAKSLPLTLTFRSGATAKATAQVRPAADGMDMSHH